MKNLLIKSLLVSGATQRLKELNQERDQLIKLIEKNSSVDVLKFEDFAKIKTTAKRKDTKRKKSYNGKHWTQTPEGKEKMRKIQLEYNKRKNAKKRSND